MQMMSESVTTPLRLCILYGGALQDGEEGEGVGAKMAEAVGKRNLAAAKQRGCKASKLVCQRSLLFQATQIVHHWM